MEKQRFLWLTSCTGPTAWLGWTKTSFPVQGFLCWVILEWSASSIDKCTAPATQSTSKLLCWPCSSALLPQATKWGWLVPELYSPLSPPPQWGGDKAERTVKYSCLHSGCCGHNSAQSSGCHNSQCFGSSVLPMVWGAQGWQREEHCIVGCLKDQPNIHKCLKMKNYKIAPLSSR